MNCFRRALLAGCAVACLANGGCHGGGTATGQAGNGVVAQSGGARIEIRPAAEHPALALVARAGDPNGAVALAAQHDFGSEPSVVFAALLETRIKAAGIQSIESRAQGLGFEVRALIGSPDDAERFVSAATRALAQPVTKSEAGLMTARQRLSTLRARSLAGESEAAVARCSGELGIVTGTSLPDPASEPGAQRIERMRQKLYSTQATAFAAVGAPALLEGCSRALARTERWPDTPSVSDPWPQRDVIGVTSAPATAARLSVALRVPNASAALDTARAVGQSDSILARLLGALDPPWSLERVVGTARARGACLRVDLYPGDNGRVSLAEAGRAAALVTDEAQAALAAAGTDQWALQESVLRPSDPREVAGAAAWRALAGRFETGPLRHFVSLSTAGSGAAATDQLLRAYDAAISSGRRSTIEQLSRLEAGQGELWAVLASPCGTLGESRYDAGVTALALYALAADEVARRDGVAIEPWVTPDGVGLLAHAARRFPAESPVTLAERVGAALGRLLGATHVAGHELAVARTRLVESIGPTPRPAFWAALDAVLPDHPSWLEPRGSFEALSEAAGASADARRRALAQGPLRLAVLSNASAEQPAVVARSAERWLRAARTDGGRCPAPSRSPGRAGEITLEASLSDAGDASGYLAMPVTLDDVWPNREAEWTVFLLNRPNGWLDQALRAAATTASARARLYGGSRAAALLVEVRASDGKTREALLEVRRALERLARGGATERELEAARASFDEDEKLAALEPRRRVVNLWLGSRSRAADLASLRRFHARLRPDSAALVVVKQRPQ